MKTRLKFGAVGFSLFLILGGFLPQAHAAPTSVPITGEIQRITINNKADPWSGGTMVVGNETVIIPANLLMDLPANRLSLSHLYSQAPAACLATGETGLAKADICNLTKTGANATISANRTNGGNVIAGDVFIQKGLDLVTGTITYINYAEGYFRVNGDALGTTGTIVRLNDPIGRHTVQSGLGCAAGSAAVNCSPDPRFTLDPDNYVSVFTTGYPLCIPKVAPPGVDPFCPSTNRPGPIDPLIAETVPDSTRFAPILVGDSVSAEGNYEIVNGVQFLSSHTTKVNKALTTLAGQPDYMFLDEAFIDAPGFQNQRARALFIGFTTRAPADVLIWSIHRDPVSNAIHEFPLATTVGCDNAAGPLTCTGLGIIPGGGDIFRIRYDVDFLIGANAKLDPCAQLLGDPRMGTGFCGGAVNPLNIKDMFGILSPVPHEIQARTGQKLLTPGLAVVDVQGNPATWGQYLFPFGANLGGIDFPNFLEINPALVATPFIFEGIPWNLDRRLSPGGCIGACEASPQPLNPFPFSGLDPRTQASTPTGTFSDTHFTASLLTVARDRILSYVSGTNFNGDATLLSLALAVDPAPIAVAPIVPVTVGLPPVIAGIGPSTATVNVLYSNQVVASGVGPFVWSLDPGFPAGMTIDATGLIQWTPATAGINPVTVRVSDPGGAAVLSFNVAVAATAGKVANDFDGDGKSDIAVWRPTDGFWYILNSSTGLPAAFQWGAGIVNDILVPADYDGDGKTDYAVWRPGDGFWYIINSSTGLPTFTQWGTGLLNDVPVPGDYDGDGKADIAVWRPGDGFWYILRSSDGLPTFTQWGALGDIPLSQ